ncbi:aldehyde dehydrogenase, dimeric NADP-preferring-like [Anoplophora glabripennis]|uniref:aldehyde dehydrogenase, dimeric NADP-preferring-like n=1 Tax=Anoplophora glabripennis TaxID=217634 RepID=UPI000873D721|nr:aldehyde dehydrogenase, dimeric NADP-preferring-like [Anoplophora glabripennis]XP_023312186.1 aldehyde dehydrogenase, dimeric NADP-preferring-like [Anoplophora glabripennis]
MSTAEDVVATARDSFNRGVTKSLEFRLKQLEALLRLIEENFKNIEDAIMKDFRKPKFEVTLYETEFLKNEIKHTIKNLKGWMKPTKVDKSLPFLMDEKGRGKPLIRKMHFLKDWLIKSP